MSARLSVIAPVLQPSLTRPPATLLTQEPDFRASQRNSGHNTDGAVEQPSTTELQA
jgi:hypothetical protein